MTAAPKLEQEPTVPAHTLAIMGSAAFALGVAERRAGRALRYDMFTGDEAWNYERGRLWATLAPVSMPLVINGKINFKAVRLFEAAGDRGLII
jgi:hypothetical protein